MSASTVRHLEEPYMWERGVTQGAIYKIHPELHVKHAQKIIQGIETATQKTLAWAAEAESRQIDIAKHLESLAWSLKDSLEVSEESSQLNLVDLKRQQTTLNILCCRIIHKVTKNAIEAGLKIAQKKIDPLNTFQVTQLKVIQDNLTMMHAEHKQNIRAHADIEQEEANSIALRKDFLEEIRFLLADPSRYETIIIKKTAKLDIEDYYLMLRDILGPSAARKKIDVEKLRNRSLAILKEFPVRTPNEMKEQCEELISDVCNQISAILATVNIIWANGYCKEKALN